MIILALLSRIVPILSDYFNISEIKNNVGIYFESHGNLHFYNDYWNIVTTLNITKFSDEILYLKDNIREIESYVYDKTFNIELTQSIVITLKALLNEIEQHEFVLEHIIERREKRSPLDFVGHVAKFLFGTLDNEDANYYIEQLSNLKETSSKSANLISKQTTILKSNMELLNHTVYIAKENFEKISETFDCFRNTVANLTEYTKIQLKVTESLNELITLAMLHAKKIEYQQDKLLSILLYAEQGKLHPYLISPKQLQQQILQISQVIPRNLFLSSRLHSFYQISNFNAILTQNNILVFQIKIPLLKINNFKVYKLIPIPIKQKDNTFTIYDIHNELIIIDSLADQHTLFQVETLNKCYKDLEYYICQQNYPLLTNNYKNCEIALYKSLSKPQEANDKPECGRRIFEIYNSIWIELSDGQSWIFLTNKLTNLNIICQNNEFNTNINNKGIIKIKNSCTMKCDGLILHPKLSNTKSNYIKYDETFISQDNYIIDKNIKHHFINTTNFKNYQPISITKNEQLIKLSKNIQDLETETNNLQTFKKIKNTHIITTVTISSTIFIIIILSILCYIRMYWVKRNKTDPEMTTENDVETGTIDEDRPNANTTDNTNIPRFKHT